MKKLLVIILLTMGGYAFAAHQTKQFLIQFATDKHALDPAALKKLEEVDAFLKQHPKAKIKLTGRTDYDGTVGYNLVLSRLRTAEVSEFLKTKGWQNAEINEKWVGELKPLATNTNDNGKAMNRSVEITITIINYDNAAQWLEEQQETYKQIITLKSSGENTITTTNNTIINIPDGAFVGPDGKIIDNKKVKLVIKEVNTIKDAIINQVSTMSGDKLLETGGMLNIEAYSNNTQLQLANDKEIVIQIPTKTAQKDMLVFEGVKDINGTVDWKNTGTKFDPNAKVEQIAKKLDEEILQSLINKINWNKPRFNTYNLNYTLPAFVKSPSKPREPRQPKKPEARSLFSTLGWLLATKNMKENRVEKEHKKNIAAYEIKLDRYQTRLELYEKRMAAHKTEIEKFETEKQNFYAWVDAMRSKIRNDKETWLDYHDRFRMCSALKGVRSKSQKGTLYEAMPFNNLKFRSGYIKFSTEQLERVEYLNLIERSLTRLAVTSYETILKKYAYNNSLKIGRIIKLMRKQTDPMVYNLMGYNNFFDTFVAANKPDFITVFGKEVEEHLKYVDKQTNALKQAQSQQYFIGNTRKMGWINCDRFVNSKLVTVSFKALKGACQLIILSGINSVLNIYNNGNSEFSRAGIPKNSKFKLLTLKIEGDQAILSISEATATSGLEIEPEYRKMPVEDLNKVLASL
ncbi:MAG: OmpA family protein [Bacteroidia bacterium]